MGVSWRRRTHGGGCHCSGLGLRRVEERKLSERGEDEECFNFLRVLEMED